MWQRLTRAVAWTVIAVATGYTAMNLRPKRVSAMVAHEKVTTAATEKRSATEKRRCRIAGSMATHRLEHLSTQRDGDSTFALLDDQVLGFETLTIPTFDGPRLRIRTHTGDGFTLEGWIERTGLTFHAKRRIVLAGETAYVPGGAELTLKASLGESVVVAPVTKDVVPIDVSTACDDVVIGPIARETVAQPRFSATAKVSVRELASGTLAVAPIPGGTPTFTLQGLVGLRVDVTETSEGLHVHLEDGLVVDGWVRPEELVVPRGRRIRTFGCGGLSISTATSSSAASGVAKLRAPIFVGKLPSGDPRGWVDEGGKVIVLDVKWGFARIIPRCDEVAAMPGESFYVPASSLDIGPTVPFATLRTGCPSS